MLDLVFISEYLTCETCVPIDILKKSFHHSPILIELNIIDFVKSNNVNNLYAFAFKTTDFISLNNYLFKLD